MNNSAKTQLATRDVVQTAETLYGVSCSGRELVTSFTSRGDPEHILQAISKEFGVRILRDDEYWYHEPTAECIDACYAMAQKADQEFYHSH